MPTQRRLRKLGAFAPLFLILLFATPALAYKTAVVAVGSVDVLDSPDPASAVLGALPKGTKVNTADKGVSGYVRVRSKILSGWVRIKDLRFAAAPARPESIPPKGAREERRPREEPRAARGGPDFNIRVNPLGLLAGGLSVNGDIAVADHFSVGPNFGYLKTTGTSSGTPYTVTAYSYGLHVTIYLSSNAFHDGWYVSPVVGYGPFNLTETINSVAFNASIYVISAGLLGGYQWFWDSGFNLTVGAGAYYYSTASTTVAVNTQGTTLTVPLSSISGVVPAVDLSVGWAF